MGATEGEREREGEREQGKTGRKVGHLRFIIRGNNFRISFNKWPQPVLPSYKYQIYPEKTRREMTLCKTCHYKVSNAFESSFPDHARAHLYSILTLLNLGIAY